MATNEESYALHSEVAAKATSAFWVDNGKVTRAEVRRRTIMGAEQDLS